MFKDTITRLRDVRPLQAHAGKPHIGEVTKLLRCRHHDITALTATTVAGNESVLLFAHTNHLKSSIRSHEVAMYHNTRQVLRPYTLQYDHNQTNYRLV